MRITRFVCFLVALTMVGMVAACGGATTTAPPADGGGATDGGDGQGPPADVGTGGGGGQEPPADAGTNGGGQEPPAGGDTSNLSGTPEEILAVMVDQLRADGVEMPIALPPTAITADISQNKMGLSEDAFNRLTVSAADSLAAIGTFAHQIVLIEAADAKSAAEVKKLVTSDGGYDPHKWICVWPEKAAAVDSGDYVLIVASYADVVDAVLDYFKTTAGTTGSVVTFYEFTGEQPDGGGLAPGGAAPITFG